ncbi:hypothetical protein D9M70_427070 [compost metagenome]
MIPGDGITVLDRQPEHAGEFRVQVAEVRHLGEITLTTLTLLDLGGTPLRLTLSGPQRLRFTEGVSLCVHLNLDLIHVMPVRQR